ncbi:ribose 5-phosphate isomerase B [Chloroflexota bacterium]
MRIAIGCDHRGLELKELIIKLIAEDGHGYEDFGCYTADSVDYPDIAKKVAEAVARSDFKCGILICNTGIGISIAANKIKGIRAALCRDTSTARQARQHNDANVLCLAGEGQQTAVPETLKAFLDTDFEGGRHLRRVDKIKIMEG